MFTVQETLDPSINMTTELGVFLPFLSGIDDNTASSRMRAPTVWGNLDSLTVQRLVRATCQAKSSNLDRAPLEPKWHD